MLKCCHSKQCRGQRHSQNPEYLKFQEAKSVSDPERWNKLPLFLFFFQIMCKVTEYRITEFIYLYVYVFKYLFISLTHVCNKIYKANLTTIP